MECIEKLYSDGVSTSSVEVEIYKYGENPTKDYRYGTDFTYIGNCLLGSTVAPADIDAGVLSIGDKEIAMAIEQDLNNIESNQKGDDDMGDVQFNKGVEIRYHGNVETNSLKFSDISNQIYNLLNPINPKNNSRSYNYYIQDMYNDYVIVEEWDDYTTLWKIPYQITNDTVVLDPQENWVKGYKGFIPEGVEINQLLIDSEQKVTELNNKIETLEKEAKATMEKTVEQLTQELSNKDTEISTLTTKVTELEGKVAELNELVVSQETSKKEMETTISELNSKVEELTPFKEQIEKAEKDAKVAELSSKYSKLLSEDTLKSERVQNAIAELNEVELSQVVVEEVLKAKSVETEVASKIETVVVTASKQEDLIPTDKKSYWHSKKAE
jgi:outer membrane murein-binding lipoprotein Lpp